MVSIAKKEFIILACLALFLVVSILPSLQYARREKRDGIHLAALVEVKHTLEQVNNKLMYYPLDFSAAPYQFVVTHEEGKQAIGWYLRMSLENTHPAESGFDFEGEHNYYYRISQERGVTMYDICGGDERCGAPAIN